MGLKSRESEKGDTLKAQENIIGYNAESRSQGMRRTKPGEEN